MAEHRRTKKNTEEKKRQERDERETRKRQERDKRDERDNKKTRKTIKRQERDKKEIEKRPRQAANEIDFSSHDRVFFGRFMPFVRCGLEPEQRDFRKVFLCPDREMKTKECDL